MKAYTQNGKNQLKMQDLSKRNMNVFAGRGDVCRIFIVGLLIIFSSQGIAQTRNVTTVEMKALTPIDYVINSNDNVEEKAIEFYIMGLSEENEIWTMEELLVNQKGIDRARMSSDMSYCVVITLKGSNINEEFIKTLVESKGFKIENYSERWINKPSIQKGVQVFIQDSPRQTKEIEDSKKIKKNKN